MAKKQTRRTVSLARPTYQALAQAASQRQLSAAHLVELALAAYGLSFEPGQHFAPADVARASEGKLWARGVSQEERLKRRREKERERYRLKRERAGKTVRPAKAHVPPEAPRLPQVSAEPFRAAQVPPIAPRAAGEPVEGRRPGGRYGAIAHRVEERRQAGEQRGELEGWCPLTLPDGNNHSEACMLVDTASRLV